MVVLQQALLASADSRRRASIRGCAAHDGQLSTTLSSCKMLNLVRQSRYALSMALECGMGPLRGVMAALFKANSSLRIGRWTLKSHQNSCPRPRRQGRGRGRASGTAAAEGLSYEAEDGDQPALDCKGGREAPDDLPGVVAADHENIGGHSLRVFVFLLSSRMKNGQLGPCARPRGPPGGRRRAVSRGIFMVPRRTFSSSSWPAL